MCTSDSNYEYSTAGTNENIILLFKEILHTIRLRILYVTGSFDNINVMLL